MSLDASILIMDEPTAVLMEPEAEALFELIAKLKAKGTTILYISHRLSEVCQHCDRVTVLRDGEWIATVDASSTSPSALADLMVGRSMKDLFPPKVDVPEAPPCLEFQLPSGRLTARPGEIVGLAGLIGAGRTELAQSLFGTRAWSNSELKLDGVRCRIRNPRQAMKHRIAYVSEDRKALGLHTSLNVIQNTTLANLKAYGTTVTDRKSELKTAMKWKEELDIRANDLNAEVKTMSGGNQQKISIAKWLDSKPRVLILDEPTRGVDVGAKREIYDLIQKLAADGMACILISSELPEIIGLCHRTYVMREGALVGELDAENLTEEAVMRLASGVVAA